VPAASKTRPTIGAVVQARLGSSRFPQKVLQELAGKPLLVHVLDRLKRCRTLDRIVVATTTDPADRALLDLAAAEGVDAFAGSEEDVLARFLGAAAQFDLDILVRICSDSPLIDWTMIDEMVDSLIEHRADYVICDERVEHACEGYEAATLAALKKITKLSDDTSDHEHVTIYIRQHPDRFSVLYHKVPELLQGPYRMSVDVAADLEFMRRIYDELYQPGEPIDVRDAVRWLRDHPEVMAINAEVKQKPVAAQTRNVLLLLGEDALAGRKRYRVDEIARHLAEHYNCVLTVAAAAPEEKLAPFAKLGYRVQTLPGGKNLSGEMLAAVETSRAALVLFDGELVGPLVLKKLQSKKITCLALDMPYRKIYKEVVRI